MVNKKGLHKKPSKNVAIFIKEYSQMKNIWNKLRVQLSELKSRDEETIMEQCKDLSDQVLRDNLYSSWEKTHVRISREGTTFIMEPTNATTMIIKYS